MVPKLRHLQGPSNRPGDPQIGPQCHFAIDSGGPRAPTWYQSLDTSSDHLTDLGTPKLDRNVTLRSILGVPELCHGQTPPNGLFPQLVILGLHSQEPSNRPGDPQIGPQCHFAIDSGGPRAPTWYQSLDTSRDHLTDLGTPTLDRNVTLRSILGVPKLYHGQTPPRTI
jgi:hypothetical protein